MYTIDELRTMPENQIFERKSIRIEPKALAIHVVAFANADGGTIVVGISDDGQIEGINGHQQKINELLRVPFDFCSPTTKVDFEYMDLIDKYGNDNRILLLIIQQSTTVHANQSDEVYYRVGDKSKKLTFDERMQLIYDKGDMLYENIYVKTAGINEIDMELVTQYAKMMDSSKPSYEFLSESMKLIGEEEGKRYPKVAAVLLFGKNPQAYFPCARIRFLKYEGTEEKTGTQMNIIKDVMFEGSTLQMLQKTLDFVQTQIKEYTKLYGDARFHTIPEYPEFVWKEAIINSVTHRDYHILGTDIQIKMFDDRFVVESPGTLPGLVRISNIRNMHFSRNPIIAKYLRDYKFVRELGEGVDRMYREMFEAGLPAPEYKVEGFMTVLTVRKFKQLEETEKSDNDQKKRLENDQKTTRKRLENLLDKTQKQILSEIELDNTITIKQLSNKLIFGTTKIKSDIAKMKELGIIKRIGSDKGGHWEVNND